MLSLIDLQRKKVEAKRKKYDKDEMDTYLELVFENYKELLEANKKLEAEKNELNQKIKKLSDGVQYYRSIETTLQKALILAEKTSKETKDAAILKAESIEKDANKKAEEIIKNAEGEYNKIKGKCVQLVQQFNQYKMQLIEAASAQLQLVEGDEFDISNPDEFEKTLDIPPIIKEQKKAADSKSAEALADNLKAELEEAVADTSESKAEDVVAEPENKSQEEESTKPTTEDILNADTIDLRTTLDAVKAESEIVAETKPEDDTENKPETVSPDVEREEEPVATTATLETPAEETTKSAEVKNATIVEPVQAKTIQPLDVVFEDQIAADKEKEKEVIEPKPAEKAAESVPTLDSLLQDLNINNKSNKKSDDPFEFLGSVDDF